jgi:hypothetical protein
MVCNGFQENPGEDVGTMKIEMPLCFLTVGSVRVAYQT